MLIKFYGFYLLFVSKIQVGIGLTGVFFQQSKIFSFFVIPEIVNNFQVHFRCEYFDNPLFMCFKKLVIID
jgi:NADH:ubiquinone oxidoreductase subunit K